MLIHIISSDPDDRDHLAFLMRKAGFVVAAHASLEHFLPSWNEQPADLVLLSWFEIDALENEIHAIRDVSEAALIVLVDSAYDQQISTMLEAGADIVLLRPFGPRTLIAYILTACSGAQGASLLLPSRLLIPTPSGLIHPRAP